MVRQRGRSEITCDPRSLVTGVSPRRTRLGPAFASAASAGRAGSSLSLQSQGQRFALAKAAIQAQSARNPLAVPCANVSNAQLGCDLCKVEGREARDRQGRPIPAIHRVGSRCNASSLNRPFAAPMRSTRYPKSAERTKGEFAAAAPKALLWCKATSRAEYNALR